ncbi:hypothetical protein Bca101_017749 [Brassica carinata]
MALHLLLVLSSYMLLTQAVEGNIDDFDCVDKYKQPAFQHPLLKHHKIQEIFSLDANLDRNSEYKTNYQSCPKGTVPILKQGNETKSIHLDTVEYPGQHFATIETVLDGSIYRGAEAWISLHSLTVQNNQYSKSQIWLENGPRNELNSIQVHPRLYGDSRTRFTMYWTADGYKNTGCYNIQCPGFVIVTRIPWIGIAFPRTSIYGSNESITFTPQVFQGVMPVRMEYPSPLEVKVETVVLDDYEFNRVWSLGPWNEQLDCSNPLSFQYLPVESQTKRNLPPLGVSINLLPWLCWSIWYSRNQLLFQNKSPSPRDMVNRAICLAKEWENAQFPPISRTPNRLPPVLTASQSNIAIRCNTDAAWKYDSATAGIGWIFTTPTAVELNRGASIKLHVATPLIAEALAIREALQQAISTNITHIWVRSDSQVLVRAINRRRGPSELHGVLSDITGLSSSFALCVFSFAPRLFNGPANALAKAHLKRSEHLTREDLELPYVLTYFVAFIFVLFKYYSDYHNVSYKYV